jgi:hypothetical protein
MNENSNQNNPNTEEVDLIVFFNYIGSLFNKFFILLNKLFKGLFSNVIYVLKALFLNWKLVLGVMIISAGIGLALQAIQPKVYMSSMLIEPKFDSKYQLVGNVAYYNALIVNNKKEELKKIFQIDNETLKSLNGFEIMLGPETENSRIIQYQQFYSQLDSISREVVDYDSFIENRSLYSGTIFEISAYASKPNVFSQFEKGLLTSFSNSYSQKMKKRRDTLLDIKISSLKRQIIQVDSLQSVYLGVIREESKAPNVRFANGDTPLIQEKQETKEFEILEKELKLRNELRTLEEQRIEEAVFYDVISSFNEVGDKVESWKNQYMFIFPILAFSLIIIIFFVKIVVDFTLNYEK